MLENPSSRDISISLYMSVPKYEENKFVLRLKARNLF